MNDILGYSFLIIIVWIIYKLINGESFSEKPTLKYAGLAAVAILVFSFILNNSNSVPNLTRYEKLRVNTSYELIRNTGVGNEFEFTSVVNGQFLRQSNIVTNTNQMSCYAKIVERDSYLYPDIGDNETTIYISDTNKCFMRVVVWEYGGISNAGTYAEFNVTFTFSGYAA
jgi:hypothetical protein